jgi:hypothetical protein
MEKHGGSYLGTEIDGRWWKRYKQEGFFVRGSGQYWFDTDAYCFLRYLTKNPLRIPYAAIQRIGQGTWHAGKWIVGHPIVKIIWKSHGQALSSGIALAGGKEGTEAFIQQLKKHLREVEDKT